MQFEKTESFYNLARRAADRFTPLTDEEKARIESRASLDKPLFTLAA